MTDRIFRVAYDLALPWSAFVAAFLYYIGLTLAIIGSADFSARTMTVVYVAPLAIAGVMLLRRLLRRIVSSAGRRGRPVRGEAQPALNAAM